MEAPLVDFTKWLITFTMDESLVAAALPPEITLFLFAGPHNSFSEPSNQLQEVTLHHQWHVCRP